MVRAGNDNELVELAEEKTAVAIGWTDMGDLPSLAPPPVRSASPTWRLR